MTNEFWNRVVAFYEPTLEMLELWAWGLPVFVIVVSSIALLSRQRQARPTARTLVTSVFPKSQHAHPSARVDRWNGILLLAIGFPLAPLFAFNAIAISDNLVGFLAGHFGALPPSIQTTWKIVALQYITYFLTLDFAGYWIHYWCHTTPFLWNMHKPHHTAETLTPWTLFRQHPIEFFFLNALPAIFAGAMLGLVLYGTGTSIHAGTVSAIGIQTYVAFFVVDVFSHVHVPISYGWLNRIVLAPIMHNLHHSMEPRHRDKNNGVLLTVWDWMFGTLYLPTSGEDWTWGLNHEEYADNNPHKTLKGFYLEPFVSTWKYLRDIRFGQAKIVVPSHE
jgi:sterol desaturase/sphingolipid hydroxylase (fatty acid hydroxylase superfamily)